MELIPLKVICRKVDIDPRIARRVLRGKLKRPSGRWAFNPDQETQVIEILQASKRLKDE